MAVKDDNFETLIAELEEEQGGSNSESSNDNNSDDNNTDNVDNEPLKEGGEEKKEGLSFSHEEIMKSEGLSKNDLPSEIQEMINKFEKRLRMAKVRKAPEKTVVKLKDMSDLIGDKIVEYTKSEALLKKDGGEIDGEKDDNMSNEEEDNDNIEDEVVNEEDSDIEEDHEDDDEEVEKKGSIFGDILGGIFDY